MELPPLPRPGPGLPLPPPAGGRTGGGVLLRWLLAVGWMLGVLGASHEEGPAAAPVRLIRWDGPAGWETLPSPTLARVLESARLDPGFAWDELVVSWNVASNVVLTVEAQVSGAGETGRWYGLGRWSGDTNRAERTSVRQAADAVAEVDTDILRLRQPRSAGVRLRLTLAEGPDPREAVRLVAAAFRDRRAPWPVLEPVRAAWGRALDVPVFSQADYPEGVSVWCSPTSSTMLLGWWAERLRRPDLRVDVRDVVRGVHDPGWPGTGNWPFNTAFLGQPDGLRACVARLGGIPDLEHWILHGCPVACSVSYALLRGAPEPRPGDGHLVVVRGFSAGGDVWVNDPGVRRDRVRRTVPRAD
ncbi:MAG: C39 family peptidase, partial [Verrucomicrobiota bacterium]